MFLWMIIACPAERLGVEVPKGGVETISMEDLQRDVYALTQPGADVGAAFAHRLAQMHVSGVEQGDGWVCGRRDGDGDPRLFVAPWPANAGDAAEDAALVSLAKGWDGRAAPPRTTWLCMARADATLPAGERVPLGIDVDAERMEAIDYQHLQAVVQARFRVLDAAPAPGAPRR
jgi:hypothetical protein